MAFDYQNAVQQGLNVDTTTNDKNVEATNLEVVFNSNDGYGKLSLINSDQTAVFVADSDGYLSIAGKMEIHGNNQTNSGYLKLQDTVGESSVFLLNTDPNGSITGTKGSLGLDYADGYAYVNRDGSTSWERLALASEVGTTITLQSAYKNDLDGGNATITTDSIDGSVVISGTESLEVDATGGLVLTTGLTQTGSSAFNVNVSASSNLTTTGADLTVSTVTTGNLNLTGAGGIVVNGNGNGVVPSSDNTDALGSASKGFTTAYVRDIANTSTVGLKDAGGASSPNTTSGAAAIGTNASNFATFGSSMSENSVQAALQAIDGYLGTEKNSTFTQKRGLELNGAIFNGVVNITHINDTPALEYAASSTSRARWTIPMPDDWDGFSDFDFEILWSPDDATIGNVVWQLEYKILNIGSLSNVSATTQNYTQASAGTAYTVESTGNNLLIPATSMNSSNAVIVANIVRLGDDVSDTYSSNALVHLITLKYQAKNIV